MAIISSRLESDRLSHWATTESDHFNELLKVCVNINIKVYNIKNMFKNMFGFFPWKLLKWKIIYVNNFQMVNKDYAEA